MCVCVYVAVVLYHGQLLYVKKVHSDQNMKLFIAVVDERVIHAIVLRALTHTSNECVACIIAYDTIAGAMSALVNVVCVGGVGLVSADVVWHKYARYLTWDTGNTHSQVKMSQFLP